MLIVQVCDFGSDGDALYRIHEPNEALGRLPGVASVDCHFASRHMPDLARRADLLILHFVNDWQLLDLLRQRRALGRATVFEANDDFFDLQPWNPIASAWSDPAVPELYRQLLRHADGVQTSTETLARRWRSLGARQVAVFPNQFAVPPAPLPAARAGPLTIGWAGSPGHFADLYAVAPALTRWLDAHPDVHLAVISAEPARSFFRLPPERYRFVPFGTRDAYLRFLDTVDIGVSPLLPTAYNRGRSDVKYLEYAARGVAGLYADLDPYRDSVRPGETGLLFGTPAEMLAGLDRLCADEALRRSIRAAAHASVSATRRLEQHIGRRLDWYRTFAGVPRPPAVTGRFSIPLEGPETALRAAQRIAHVADRLPAFRAIAEANPTYRAAVLALARDLNATRNVVEALALLRTRAADPSDDAEIGAEVARSLHLLGDEPGARAALDAVVAREPHALPAWHYLLRLAALVGAEDGPLLAERAQALFPESFEIALLGAELQPAARRVAALTQAVLRHGPQLPRDRRSAAAARLCAILEGLAAQREHDTTLEESVSALCDLVRAACVHFPESAQLSGMCGSLLHAAGRGEEAFRFEARAHALSQGERAEEHPPLVWQLAHHIMEVEAAGGAVWRDAAL